MHKKKRICVISFSDLRKDPRVRRQIFALKDTYEVTSLGLKKSGIKGIDELIIPDPRTFLKKLNSRLTFLLARLLIFLYRNYIKKKYPIKAILDLTKERRFDLIVANGLDSLVIAHSIADKDGAKILFDAHEYEPRRIEDHWFHKLFVNPYKDFLCKRYLPFIDAMTTSSFGFAREYHKQYGIESEIVKNVPRYKKFSLGEVTSNNIKLIHHGYAHPSRKLEQMLKLMPLLEKRFNLTLMLVGENKYLKHLMRLSANLCPERIVFKKPVSFDKIVPTIAKHDVGLLIIEPTSLKLKYALPNKLFESIMAGLCVISGPSPEMVKVIKEYNCGFVADSFNIKNIAQMINSLTVEDIKEKKKASLEAAKFLNAENEMEKFYKIIRNLIGD
ncbi:glycosyltransferase [candidate division WOR-3 bacterium]|nr:glycosyltransferase [candidate division WOR-3 bacterium]